MNRERPLRILVVALLSLVVGAYGAFVGSAAMGNRLLFFVFAPPPPPPTSQNTFQPREQEAIDLATFLDRKLPERAAVDLLNNGALCLAGLLLVMIAFGLLHMRPWARWLGIAYCLAMLLTQSGHLVYQLGYVLPVVHLYPLDQSWRWYYGSGSSGGLEAGHLLFLLVQTAVFMAHALVLAVVLVLPIRATDPAEEIAETPAESPAGAALGSV